MPGKDKGGKKTHKGKKEKGKEKGHGKDTKSKSAHKDKKSKDAKSKDAKSKGAKGKDAKEKHTKDKDTKGKDTKHAKDKHTKDKHKKDKDAKDKPTKDKHTKDKEGKDKEGKDKDAKDKDAKDKDVKDKDTKDKEGKDKEGKDKDGKDKDAKDKDAKDKDVKAKDKDAKDVKAKDKDIKDKESKPDAKKDDKAKKMKDSLPDGKKKEEHAEAKVKAEDVDEKGKKAIGKAKAAITKGWKSIGKAGAKKIVTKEQKEELVTKTDVVPETAELVNISPTAIQTTGLDELDQPMGATERTSISARNGEVGSVKSVNIVRDNEELRPIEETAYYPNDTGVLENRDGGYYPTTDTMDNEQARFDNAPTQDINQTIDEMDTGRSSVSLYKIPEEREPSFYGSESRIMISNKRRLYPTESVYSVDSTLRPVDSRLQPAESRLQTPESAIYPTQSAVYEAGSVYQQADSQLSTGEDTDTESNATSSDASTSTSERDSSSNLSSSEASGTNDENTPGSTEGDGESRNQLLYDKFDQSTMTETEVETSAEEGEMSQDSTSSEVSVQSTSSEESRGSTQSDVPYTWVRLKKDEDQYFKRGRNKQTTEKNTDSTKEIRKETGAAQEPTRSNSNVSLQSESDHTSGQTSPHDYPVAKWASLTFASADDAESVSEAESLIDQKSSSSKKRKKKQKRRQETPVSEPASSSTSFATSPVEKRSATTPVEKRSDDAVVAALEATQTSSENITKATYEMRDAINKLAQLLNNMNLNIRNLATSYSQGRISRDGSRYEVSAGPNGHPNPNGTSTGYRYMEPQYVHVKVVFIRIMDVDTLNQNFEAEVYIQARWVEKQFAGLSEHQLAEIEFSKCWNPCLKIVNACGSLESEKISMLLQYEPEIEHPVLTYMWNVRGIFREHLELHHFPFDVQELNVVISSDLSVTELELINDFYHQSHVNNRALKESQDWVAYQHIEFQRDYSTLNLMGTTKHPVLRASAHVKRRLGFYFWNVVIIVFLIIGLSICVLAIEPTSTDRLGLLLTLFLTAVAFKLVVKTTLPTISYLTYLDIYVVFTLIYLALQAAVSAIMINLAKYRDRSHILVYDEIAQSLLISLLILFHLIFLIYIQLTALRRRRQMKQKDREYLLSHMTKTGPVHPQNERQTQTSISLEQRAGDGNVMK